MRGGEDGEVGIMGENWWQEGEGEQSHPLHPVYHRTDYFCLEILCFTYT